MEAIGYLVLGKLIICVSFENIEPVSNLLMIIGHEDKNDQKLKWTCMN